MALNLFNILNDITSLNLWNCPVGPPPSNNNMDEPLSSASIFEHVDRMSRAADGPKRPPNKIQLIAMQPMPALPLPSFPANDKAAENAKLSKEVPIMHLFLICYAISMLYLGVSNFKV